MKDMEDANVYEGLVSFIREEIREFTKPMTRDTLIEDDLGVTGEEASEMIQRYSKKYNIDISRFYFAKYFNEEPSIFLDSETKKALTLGHLEKAIIAGRLDEEIINSPSGLTE